MRELADILRDWIDNHPILKDHFKVYKQSEWPEPKGGAYLPWPFDASAAIHMECGHKDYFGLCFGIRNDHVYYSYSQTVWVNPPPPRSLIRILDTKAEEREVTFKIMAADKDFFHKIESDLLDTHWERYKEEYCDVEIASV